MCVCVSACCNDFQKINQKTKRSQLVSMHSDLYHCQTLGAGLPILYAKERIRMHTSHAFGVHWLPRTMRLRLNRCSTHVSNRRSRSAGKLPVTAAS